MFRKFPENTKLSIIDRWATHPLLIKTFAERIKEELNYFSESVRKDVIILFSAHSLPLKVYFFLLYFYKLNILKLR
jgi:ferrochelatase